jgi:O-antigen ligase/polysaccharide polymerase Wzy-like membrane protein
MYLILALGLVLITARLAAHRPWLGVSLLLVTLPLDFPFEIGITAYTNELALVGLMLGGGYYWWKEKAWSHLNWTPLFRCLPFLLALVLSVLFSQVWGAGAKQIIRWLQIFLVIWFTTNALQSKDQYQKVIAVFIAAAALASLYGLLKALVLNIHSGQLMLYGGDVVRVNSFFGHSNQFGGYLLCVLPLAVVGFFQAQQKWLKIGAAVSVVLMSSALLFTYTRSLWVVAALVGSVWLYFKIPRKVFLLVCVGLLVLGGLFAANAAKPGNPGHRIYQRVVSIFQPSQEDSVNFRLVCTRTALDMFKKNPITGFGAGNYAQNIKKYFSEDYYAWEGINKHIHNLFLQILIETGLLGLLGILFLIVMSLRGMILARWYAKDAETAPWLEAMLAGAIAFLLANGFDVLTIYARGIHLGLLLGMGLGMVYMQQKKPKVQ